MKLLYAKCLSALILFVQKHSEETAGTASAGVGGFYAARVYEDWVRPILLAAVCALVGLLVTHFGKKLLKKLRL